MTGDRADRSGLSVLSRRRLLAWALGAGGFVTMGGVGGWLALRGRAPAVAGLRCLTAHEHRTLAALARALFPADGPIPVSADDLELARAFDGFLADEGDANRRDLKRALFLLEMGPVLFGARLATFSHLSADERRAHFTHAWAESDTLLRRQVALAFRKFLSLVFYDQPAVWPHIGYPGPSLAVREGRT